MVVALSSPSEDQAGRSSQEKTGKEAGHFSKPPHSGSRRVYGMEKQDALCLLLEGYLVLQTSTFHMEYEVCLRPLT